MDEFANLPDDNEFGSLPDDNKIPPSENILQRAVNIGKQFGQPVQMGENPFMTGAKTALSSMSGNFAPQVSREAQDLRREGVEGLTDNPVTQFGLDIATDPSTYIGGGAVAKRAKPIAREAGKLVAPVKRGLFGKPALELSNRMENIIERKGAQASKKFGRALEEVQASKPDVRVSFLDDVTKPQMDSKVTKLINRTDNLNLYDLDNLSLKDSQQVINDLKANLRQSLKTGDLVKSDEREILRFIGELKSKQRASFPEIDAINKSYGTTKEAVDELSGSIPGIMEGQGNRIQRAAKVKQSGEISPAIEKILGRERQVRNVAKAIPIVGTALEGFRRLTNG